MRTLIIEEEQNELAELHLLLQAHFPQVEIVGTASNGPEGLQLIAQHQPKLVLLGIHLPDKEALELLQLLEHRRFVLLCLENQASQHTQPLRLTAVNCLQKPVSLLPLATSLHVAQQQLQEQQVLQQLSSLLNLKRHAMESCIVLPMGTELRLINPNNILHCEAANSYTHFYLTGNRVETVSRGLFQYAEQLECFHFFKASRSAMVNIAHVESLSWKDNAHELILRDGHTRIQVPRTWVDTVKERLFELTGTKWK